MTPKHHLGKQIYVVRDSAIYETTITGITYYNVGLSIEWRYIVEVFGMNYTFDEDKIFEVFNEARKELYK